MSAIFRSGVKPHQKHAVKPSMAASQQRPCCWEFLMGLHSLRNLYTRKLWRERREFAVNPSLFLRKSSETASMRCRISEGTTITPFSKQSKRLRGRRCNTLSTHPGFFISGFAAASMQLRVLEWTSAPFWIYRACTERKKRTVKSSYLLFQRLRHRIHPMVGFCEQSIDMDKANE